MAVGIDGGEIAHGLVPSCFFADPFGARRDYFLLQVRLLHALRQAQHGKDHAIAQNNKE
jgi:hypothetical protein